MKPAFRGTSQAVAFVLLLLVLLALPLLISTHLLAPRAGVYASILWDDGRSHRIAGPYAYTGKSIFNEKGPIDIAFLGASHMWMGVDAKYVETQLSARLHRPAVVRSLCWTSPGFDALSLIGQDALKHRQIGMIVFDDLYNVEGTPHIQTPSLFRFSEDHILLVTLPLRLQLEYYFAAVMGMPKNLLLLVRSGLPESDAAQPRYAEEHRGSMQELYNFGTGMPVEAPFHPYAPDPTGREGDTLVYSGATKEKFTFDSSTLEPWQLSFAQDFTHLATREGTALVLLHLPSVLEEGKTTVPERTFWPTALDAKVTMVGVPSSQLFAGLNDAQMKLLFMDPAHLNANGQEYFTKVITPKLLDLYQALVKP